MLMMMTMGRLMNDNGNHRRGTRVKDTLTYLESYSLTHCYSD